MTAQPTLFDTPATTRTTPAPRPADDDWLTAHLIASGHMTPDRITRAARIRTCPTCHTTTLAGLDGDICAIPTTCDPRPLTPLGEALALLEHRRTIHLHRGGGRWELDGRHHTDITWAPAGTATREDVLAEHRCGQPIPRTWSGPSTFPETHPSTRLAPGSPPPF